MFSAINSSHFVSQIWYAIQIHKHCFFDNLSTNLRIWLKQLQNTMVAIEYMQIVFVFFYEIENNWVGREIVTDQQQDTCTYHLQFIYVFECVNNRGNHYHRFCCCTFTFIFFVFFFFLCIKSFYLFGLQNLYFRWISILSII